MDLTKNNFKEKYEKKRYHIVNKLFEGNKEGILNEVKETLKNYNVDNLGFWNEYLKRYYNEATIKVNKYSINDKNRNINNIEKNSKLEFDINNELRNKYKKLLKKNGYLIKKGILDDELELFISRKELMKNLLEEFYLFYLIPLLLLLFIFLIFMYNNKI